MTASAKGAAAKGKRAVTLVCQLHRAAGVLCNVVPRSGAAAGFKGDVRIHLLDGDPLVGEVKSRPSGSGFATLQRWLGSNDLLVVKQDREPPLVQGYSMPRAVATLPPKPRLTGASFTEGNSDRGCIRDRTNNHHQPVLGR